jgi:nicotinamide-nucleotide amidase
MKTARLGIDKAILREHGAVSREAASAMAAAARCISGSDIGIGITGIAGPGGGSKKKPVGLAYIACCAKKKRAIREFRFLGTRPEIKLRVARQALDMLRYFL